MIDLNQEFSFIGKTEEENSMVYVKEQLLSNR